MRIAVLYLAIVMMAAGLIPRTWAHAETRSGSVHVGALGFVEYNRSESRDGPLRKLNNAGRGLERKGLSVLVLGIAAAVAFAIASQVMRRVRLRRWHRVALAAPALGSLVATIVFASHLADLRYLDLDRSVVLCIGSAVLGLIVVVPARAAPLS